MEEAVSIQTLVTIYQIRYHITKERSYKSSGRFAPMQAIKARGRWEI